MNTPKLRTVHECHLGAWLKKGIKEFELSLACVYMNSVADIVHKKIKTLSKSKPTSSWQMGVCTLWLCFILPVSCALLVALSPWAVASEHLSTSSVLTIAIFDEPNPVALVFTRGPFDEVATSFSVLPREILSWHYLTQASTVRLCRKKSSAGVRIQYSSNVTICLWCTLPHKMKNPWPLGVWRQVSRSQVKTATVWAFCLDIASYLFSYHG